MDITKLLAITLYRAFDVDAEGRILAGSDATGSVQLVEIQPDGTEVPLTALPGACSGHYLPGQPADLLPAATQALQRHLPRGLRRRPRAVAVDWHLRPYYGSPRTAGVTRGKEKASTKYFFAYASALVVVRGQPCTVGLTHVIGLGSACGVHILEKSAA